MNRKIFLVILGILLSRPAYAKENSSFTVFAPLVGKTTSKIAYTNPGTGSRDNLQDDGVVYSVDLAYITPRFVLGTVGHYTNLDKTDEQGILFFADYGFRQYNKMQPTIGLSLERIGLYTQLGPDDVPGLVSLDVNIAILATHATAGLSVKELLRSENIKARVVPFVGYFNEKVEVAVSSPGVRIAGQNRFGFKTNSAVSLDYVTAGAKIELSLWHFVNFNTKFYFRFKQDEETLYTVRNRLDLYISRRLAISAKVDYFKDKYETNMFIVVGPGWVF